MLRVKREIPPVPKNLLKVNRDSWVRYWNSQLSQATDVETDLPAIKRLWTLYDERERVYRLLCEKGRLVRGSQGQAVINPAARYMSDLDAEIRQMEDRLGLTPRSRLQLGITLSEAAKSIKDLNEALEIDEAEDPREE